MSCFMFSVEKLLVCLWCTHYRRRKQKWSNSNHQRRRRCCCSGNETQFGHKRAFHHENCCRCTKGVQFQCVFMVHLSVCSFRTVALHIFVPLSLLTLKMKISMLTELYVPIECLHSTRCNWCSVCVYVFYFHWKHLHKSIR